MPDSSDRQAFLNVHGALARSRANGPGERFVVWLQGCDQNCPGCFNPETHPQEARYLVVPDKLFEILTQNLAGLEGVSVSGGEPLLQAPALLRFLKLVRSKTSLSVLIFSGFYRKMIEQTKHGPAILELTDVLVDGPFIREIALVGDLRGSANQTIHLVTGRYSAEDLKNPPPAEVFIRPDGTTTLSGLDPLTLTEAQAEDQQMTGEDES